MLTRIWGTGRWLLWPYKEEKRRTRGKPSTLDRQALPCHMSGPASEQGPLRLQMNVLVTSHPPPLSRVLLTKSQNCSWEVQVGKDQEKAQSEKRFPLQKPRWEKTKLTIRYLYHETYRKPNEQLFSQ